jgi:hypothetical protein
MVDAARIELARRPTTPPFARLAITESLIEDSLGAGEIAAGTTTAAAIVSEIYGSPARYWEDALVEPMTLQVLARRLAYHFAKTGRERDLMIIGDAGIIVALRKGIAAGRIRPRGLRAAEAINVAVAGQRQPDELVEPREAIAWLRASLWRNYVPETLAAPRQGGRSEARYWSGAHHEIDRWLNENGCPARGDGEQAVLEKYIADWLAERADPPPSKSTIRQHVKARMKLYKTKIAEGR